MSLKREVSLYVVFGVLTTLVSLLTYKLFLYMMHYMIATSLSTALAITFAYVTNRKYVFKSKGRIGEETIKFFTGRIFAYFIETILLYVLVSLLSQDEFIAKLVVTVIVIVLNYIYSKLIVFKEAKGEKI